MRLPAGKRCRREMGGIFGIGTAPTPGPKGDTGNAPKKCDFLCKRFQGSAFATGPEYPKSGVKRINREGTGPYKSSPHGRTSPALPNHTIYAPLTPPPASVKLPVEGAGELSTEGMQLLVSLDLRYRRRAWPPPPLPWRICFRWAANSVCEAFFFERT
jgi:hypothetical protein